MLELAYDFLICGKVLLSKVQLLLDYVLSLLSLCKLVP